MESPLIIKIDADLEDLIPGFLANRASDIQAIEAALAARDFGDLRRLGHIMKGVGAGYGFPQITELGAAIEAAALRQDAPAIDGHAHQLREFLERIVIVYEEQE